MELIKQNPQSQIIKSLFIIFLGSIILTISAKIKIPFYPVPMTMQTFVVLFLGISFGYKIALTTVGLYLLEGIIGIPVFSNSPEKGIGLVYFTGPTMGYLIGFLFAVFFAGYLDMKNNIFQGCSHVKYFGDKYGLRGSRFGHMFGRSRNVPKNIAIGQESLISHLGIIKTP